MIWKEFEENTKLISIKTKVYVQKVGLIPTWRPKRLLDMYKRNGTYTLREAHDQFELEFKRFERKTLIWFAFSKNKSNWSWYKKCISQENILWTFEKDLKDERLFTWIFEKY